MPTIAELQIRLDSTPVQEGTKALNEFSTAAEKAGKATKQKQQIDDQSAASAEKISRSADQANAAISRQAKELETLIGKIDPVTKKLNDLAKQENTLFANKGNIPTEAFDRYNKILEESFNKLLSVGSAQKQLASSTDGVPERLLRIGEAAVTAANGQQNLTTALRGASEAEQGLVSSGAVEASRARADAALAEFNARRKATEASREAGAAAKAEAADIGELSSRIDPTLKKLRELADQQKQLNQAFQAGAFKGNEAEFNRLNGVLDRNREAYKRLNSELSNTGKTAKEMAFAMRGLPAQFTDIVVSLQGGQAPLTVLLQQGGQIKDMFGGIVPAIRAMAQGLMAMITPATLGAAALAGLAIAAYQGSNELTAFNRAIILTNNAAGVSTSQFAAYRDVLDSTVTTSGKAAEALTLIASGGRILNDQFVNVAESAILFQKATGQALADTINDFNAIGKEPVEAAVRLDEKYKFLTVSVLAQADAMVRAGQDTEAAAFLQDTLAKATTDAAIKVIEQAGYMEQAWNGVKSAISSTWDALKQIGRDTTSTDRLTELQKQLEALETRQKNNQNLFGGLGGSGIQKEIDAQKVLITQVKQRIQYEQYAAKTASDAEDRRRDGVTNFQSALRRQEYGLKGVEKAENDLRKVRLENDKVRAAGNITSEQSRILADNEARSLKALADAKEAEARKGKPKTSAIDSREVQTVKNNLNELNAEYDGYYKRITALGSAGIVSAEATFQSQKSILTAQKKAVSDSYDAQIEAIKTLLDNKKNSASQNINLENQLSKAESDRVIAMEKIDAKQDALAAKEQGRIDKRTASISAYKAALDAQLENLQEEGQRAADGVGRGDNAAALARQMNENDRAFAKQQRSLSKSLSEGMDIEEYNEKLKALQDTHSEMTSQILKNNDAIQASNGDWTNGFTRAIENAAEQGRNFAQTTEQLVTGAFDSMSDALGTFATTGKINFRSLTASILADMAKIAAKQATSAALSSLFGLAMSAFGGMAAGGANGFAAGSAGAQSSALGASSAGYSSTYFPQAKGGGWSGGTQFFADGGAFTNSIVSTPTSFAMSGGKQGVMGEAGPEAIVPLARASDGSLGVRMIGGEQAKGGVNVYVTITNTGNQTETDDQGYAGFGKEIGNLIDARYRELQAKDLSAGGDLRRAINERG